MFWFQATVKYKTIPFVILATVATCPTQSDTRHTIKPLKKALPTGLLSTTRLKWRKRLVIPPFILSHTHSHTQAPRHHPTTTQLHVAPTLRSSHLYCVSTISVACIFTKRCFNDWVTDRVTEWLSDWVTERWPWFTPKLCWCCCCSEWV
jgi:hypothetical protein